MAAALLLSQAGCHAEDIAAVAQLAPAGQVALFVFASVVAAGVAWVAVTGLWGGA